MNRHIILALAIFAALLGGFLASDAMNPYFRLKLESSITFGNVMQALATLAAGFVVALYLQPRTQADRKEKDILLRQIDLLLETVAELEKFKDGGAITEITASLKKFSVGLRAIKDILKYLNYSPAVRDHVRLEGQLKMIRKLTTETPIAGIEAHANAAKSNSVKNGIIELAAEKRALLDSQLHEVKLQLLKAQIEINEA